MSDGPRDPFPPTADPAGYVPREASERALAELEAALADGATRILLHGPPGIGKTLLVRVLQQRSSAAFRHAEASYPALPCSDLCDWVLRALGEEAGTDPEAALVALAVREPTRPLLLLVDDAHSLPPGTAAGLRALVERAGGALRLLAIATDGEGADALGAALSPERDVRLDRPLTRSEVEGYVKARLDAASAPEAIRQRFDARTLARLHEESDGVPGRLHQGATALVLGRRPDPPMAAERTVGSASVAPPPGAGTVPPLDASASPAVARRWPRGPLLLALVAALGLGAWLALRTAPATRSAATPAPAPGAAGTAPPAGVDAPLPTPEPAAPPGPAAFAEPRFSVHVNATPWAEIELDGRALGVTPLAAVEVEPGRHRVRARMPDGRILERDVILSPERRHLVFE